MLLHQWPKVCCLAVRLVCQILIHHVAEKDLAHSVSFPLTVNDGRRVGTVRYELHNCRTGAADGEANAYRIWIIQQLDIDSEPSRITAIHLLTPAHTKALSPFLFLSISLSASQLELPNACCVAPSSISTSSHGNGNDCSILQAQVRTAVA